MFIMPFSVRSLLLPPHALGDGGSVAQKLPSSNDAAFVSREICRSPPISLSLSLLQGENRMCCARTRRMRGAEHSEKGMDLMKGRRETQLG
jgi:hypothetical protein